MINILEEIGNSKSIAISAHERPDGDAIGSCLGLYLYLKKMLPDAYIKIFLEKPSNCFEIIPSVKDIDCEMTDETIFDVFFVIDTSSERLGNAFKYFEKASKTINIDHHISNKDGCGDVNYIVPDASSASELIFKLIDRDCIDNEIATVLYMGIAHDTGVFRYSNTSPETMKICSFLREYDFDFSHILDVTYFEKSFPSNKVLGIVLGNCVLVHEGRFIIGTLTAQELLENNATKDDTDGIVNALMTTKGVFGACFIYSKNEEVVKVSLRSSTDELDVSAVAQLLGGGGHKRAAGCDYKGTVNAAKEKVIELIGEALHV